ncbi:MAG: protein-ADP-ribose hydrolase [Clostridiales bacterium]|nr:protein-ADP-ribose hydrolase [Clostridiales bacterium]
MTRLEQLLKLNQWLLEDMPEYQSQVVHFQKNEHSQWQLFRSLVNVREPRSVSDAFIELQDEFLKKEIEAKGITNIADLTPIQNKIYLWQGDITTRCVDAVVNAANRGMTGCYCPCHGCIDNAIHTFSGIQLRQECAEIIKRQGYPEPTGQAKITKAYNLPCKYVIHTVGPIVDGELTEKHRQQLASCYRSCLELAEKNNLESIAFCCISTGKFHFPNREAAKIAVHEIQQYHRSGGKCSVAFNVFKETDLKIYKEYLFL